MVLNELGMRVVNDVEIETSLACHSGGICHSSELVSHLCIITSLGREEEHGLVAKICLVLNPLVQNLLEGCVVLPPTYKPFTNHCKKANSV